jgi:enoyl-CoA hydratase
MALDYSEFKLIKAEVKEQILVITLNDPDNANALGWMYVKDLKGIFNKVAQDNDVRAVIWRAEGADFSHVLPGAPIHRKVDDPHPLQGLELAGPGIHMETAYHMSVLRALLDVPQPIIVAAHGRCTGMAANCVLCCDIIFGTEDLIMNDQHVNKAMVTGDGGAVIWPLIIGPAKAKEYLLTGDSLTGPEAERLGMINHVVPLDQLDKAVWDFAKRLTEGATMAQRFSKHVINRIIEKELAYTWEFSDALQILTCFTEDYKETRAAAREKRPPKFTGR